MRDRSRKLLIIAVVAAGLAVIDVALSVRVFRPRLLDANLYAGGNDRPAPFTADRYAAVLEHYVDADGLVDYQTLKNSTDGLNEFLRAAARLDPKTHDAWPENRKIAFWVNVYNALTLRVVTDHYPIRPSGLRRLRYPPESIRQVPGVRERLRFVVMGEQVTLDDVERRLRQSSDDPRLHMATVRAARGSGPLRKEPYEGDKLDEQLDDQARRFLRNPASFRIDRQAGKVYLSSLFQWFGGDFVAAYTPQEGFGAHRGEVGAVLNFVAGYLEPAEAEYLRTGAFAVEYAEFDWGLNRQTHSPSRVKRQ